MAGTAVGSAKRRAVELGITLDEYHRRLADGLKWCTGCIAFGDYRLTRLLEQLRVELAYCDDVGDVIDRYGTAA